MDAVAQPELFGGLFEGSERKRSVRARFKELVEEHGPLYPQNLLPLVLDVSRARVSQLVQEGRFPVFEVGGHNYIPMVAIEFFETEERKAGRPVEQRTMSENYRQLFAGFRKRKKSQK